MASSASSAGIDWSAAASVASCSSPWRATGRHDIANGLRHWVALDRRAYRGRRSPRRAPPCATSEHLDGQSQMVRVGRATGLRRHPIGTLATRRTRPSSRRCAPSRAEQCDLRAARHSASLRQRWRQARAHAAHVLPGRNGRNVRGDRLAWTPRDASAATFCKRSGGAHQRGSKVRHAPPESRTDDAGLPL